MFCTHTHTRYSESLFLHKVRRIFLWTLHQPTQPFLFITACYIPFLLMDNFCLLRQIWPIADYSEVFQSIILQPTGIHCVFSTR